MASRVNFRRRWIPPWVAKDVKRALARKTLIRAIHGRV